MTTRSLTWINQKNNLIFKLAEKIFSVPVNNSLNLNSTKEIILVCQHNSLYELLGGISLLRALKENCPDSVISLLIGDTGYPGKLKIKYADRIFSLNKLKLFNPFFIFGLYKFLRKRYDVAIVPVILSISHFSNFLARISNTKSKIGIKYYNGKLNQSYFFFSHLINIDWRKHPDSHISERILDILRPFSITTSDFRTNIEIEDSSIQKAEKFLSQFANNKKNKIVGLSVSAINEYCSWSIIKFCSLLRKLNENYLVDFYLINSGTQNSTVNFIKKNINFSIKLLTNRSIEEIAAVISKSDLFISNDSVIMQIAGSTATPQISIFGPTNPFNWAPIGANKYFIRKSELIDDIAVDDVYHLCELILIRKGNEE